MKSTSIVSHIVRPRIRFSRQLNVNDIHPDDYATAESLKRALGSFDDNNCIEPYSTKINTNLSIDFGAFQYSHSTPPILSSNEYTYDYLVSDPTFGLINKGSGSSNNKTMTSQDDTNNNNNSKNNNNKIALNKRGNRFFVTPSIDDSHEKNDIFANPQTEKSVDSLAFISDDATKRSAIKKSSLISFKSKSNLYILMLYFFFFVILTFSYNIVTYIYIYIYIYIMYCYI